MIGTIFALLPVNNVKFAKKFLIYFLNYKMPIFFNPNTRVHCSSENIPYQPVAWRIFSATNKNQLSIQIAKSKQSLVIITDNGEVC